MHDDLYERICNWSYVYLLCMYDDYMVIYGTWISIPKPTSKRLLKETRVPLPPDPIDAPKRHFVFEKLTPKPSKTNSTQKAWICLVFFFEKKHVNSNTNSRLFYRNHGRFTYMYHKNLQFMLANIPFPRILGPMFFNVAPKNLSSETVHRPSDGGSLGGFGFEGEVTSFGGTLVRVSGVAATANQPTCPRIRYTPEKLNGWNLRKLLKWGLVPIIFFSKWFVGEPR